MRRILSVMTVALVMAAMLVVMAGAASAQPVVFVPYSCLHGPSDKLFGSMVIPPSGQINACTGGTPLGPAGPPQNF
jgi:hypothetical protein